jgi:hypothetical protein
MKHFYIPKWIKKGQPHLEKSVATAFISKNNLWILYYSPRSHKPNTVIKFECQSREDFIKQVLKTQKLTPLMTLGDQIHFKSIN